MDDVVRQVVMPATKSRNFWLKHDRRARSVNTAQAQQDSERFACISNPRTDCEGDAMKFLENTFFTAIVFYEYYAAPVDVIFAFLLTRGLSRGMSSVAAVRVTLALTLVIFTPLVIPMHNFFPEFYAPWYLTFIAFPPTPQFSLMALVITTIVSLVGSWVAVIVDRS
jgi:hypothetical protein